MGLDLSVYKINRQVSNTKSLRMCEAGADKLFQIGLKNNNKRLLLMATYTEIAIKENIIKDLVADLDKRLNYIKARKLNLIEVTDYEVLYSRGWYEFYNFCKARYDRGKEGCMLDFYGRFIIDGNIAKEILSTEFEDNKYLQKLKLLINNTDFNKETLYVTCWG